MSKLEAQAEYERSRDRAAALAEKEAEAGKDKERLEKIKVREADRVCDCLHGCCGAGERQAQLHEAQAGKDKELDAAVGKYTPSHISQYTCQLS